ncbi:hypothetical protein BKA65DRAFT_450661 [Rhexocercosporidium sp. MPI-PUGE-AT-0058]|nr:hypothetical protein BKA65DRAFT_450661 [Rhexocercosporidium sp. MPI-PUGE-AT-0058]
MSSTSVPAIKRPKRRGLPKTKSGCRTCKQRRVKCGEERPFCLRCVKFGVQCDGYGVLENPANLPGRSSMIQPKSSSQSLSLQDIPFHPLFCISQENRYFEVFCNKTAFEILPTFDSSSTALRQVILQTCESEPSIRHAVIALGALDLAAGTLQDFTPMSLDAFKETPLQHHQNALKQYSTAIKEMRQAALTRKQDLRTTLLTCLVIMCFEAWNGNQDLAIRQIQTGFRLIRAWREEVLGGGDERRFVGLEAGMGDTVEDELVRVFKRLDVQAISFTSETTPESHALVLSGELSLLHRMPQLFTTAREATTYANALVRQTMRFFSEQIPLPVPPPPQVFFPMHGWWGVKIPHVVAIQQRIMTDVLRWNAAFAPLWRELNLHHQERNEEKGDREEEYFLASVSRMHIQILWIGLITICTDNESQFDDYLDHFQEVVDLAEYALSVQNAKSKTPKFTFDSLVVIPLYMVTFKCRDPIVRRKAVRLLLENPRREGVWDSVLGGRMGEWVMCVEEEYVGDDGRVPGWARIHWVALERDREKRCAMLSCEQRICQFSEEVVTRRKIITW